MQLKTLIHSIKYAKKGYFLLKYLNEFFFTLEQIVID